MKTATPLKSQWTLTQDAFDGLLARLDPDRERAGQRYEQIRRALITFFECRGSATPDDHADETINRVARRLTEGAEIHAAQPASYFYGVARNVLKEWWDAGAARSTSLDSAPATVHPSIDPVLVAERETERSRNERRLDCLDRCLRDLAPFAKEIITGYYQGETQVKIHNRKRLAERIGIPINALRIRALRIREKLEACVDSCQGQPDNG